MSDVWDEPSDEVLLALGRVTWGAINLEDTAQTVAEGVLERDRGRTAIGAMLLEAEGHLAKMAATPSADECARWMRAAREALSRRNAVLHSVPVTTLTGDEALVHFPNSGAAHVFTWLDATSLGSLADELATLWRSWLDAYDFVIERHEEERATTG